LTLFLVRIANRLEPKRTAFQGDGLHEIVALTCPSLAT